MTVAKTILSQLGGGVFLCMTGAKSITHGEDSLTFRLPGSNFCKSNINLVSVKLEPSDTYTVTFARLRGTAYKEVVTVNDVYADNLRQVFTEHTGLDTHL